MKAPLEVQDLCKHYLEKIKQDPQHNLSDKDRLELFLKFGFSRILDNTTPLSLLNYTTADFALCWLAFLTAKKVAFICQRGPTDFEESEADEIRKILKAAESYLNRSTTLEEAGQVLDDYWYFFRPHLTYDVLCAWRTSMHSLEFILYGAGFDNFVLDAIEAYTVIDYNLPGEGNSPEPPIPLEYDITKRLIFWEWWLAEAIPQAWTLATESQ